MSIKVKINNEEKTFKKPVSILDIIGDNRDFVCARVNNRVRELTYVLQEDSHVEPLTVKDRDAIRSYEGSLRYLIAMAMHNIAPGLEFKVSYYVSRSIFMQRLNEGRTETAQLPHDLIEEMNRIVAADYPLKRKKMSKKEAAEIFEKENFLDKIEILEVRPEETAHMYECEGYSNYMYERLVPSTGYIKNFNIRYYSPGIIIQYPRAECKGEIPEFEDAPIYGRTLKRAHSWARAAGIDTISGINKIAEKFGSVDFINMCEHQHNYQFAELGDLIEKDISSIRLICIAGPSSSGKTTFANRLRIELLSRGIRPVRISIDDYYLPKAQAPKDENGDPDLEDIHALDIDTFNQNISDLIEGLEVQLPKFDFQLGHRVLGRKIKVAQNEPIIIEGIHALNDMLTLSIPRHQKFKIYIAPQAQINIDNHNPLSLTDLRLLRRIVRDYQFRNASAVETLVMWPSVRKGEFKWIYDNQEDADFVFNSFLIYELSVLKKYAMPLLRAIDSESPHFPVSERLIRMLKFFNDLPDEWVPCNSLLREFIGKSCYADV
ncbi:MAG: nucleoside kinase [Erysipelotrichia bacterium]|nr:nucleoside kinase [Erysipelotrichia bacterium]